MDKKALTIGMCTYDDFDGVYFTIQSLRLYHQILSSIDYEIVVIDNNPNSEHGHATRDFINGHTNGYAKYIPYTDKTSTSIRNEIFRNAKGQYCLSLDCHVLLQSGAIESLVKYYSNHPDCKDLIQGPLLYDNLIDYSTEFTPIWRGHMYGVWGKKDIKDPEPFEIPMMGLGLFSCETKNWRGFNPLFKGFGGEEGYIHEKFRRNGGSVVCLPELRWVHRFPRPNGVKYPLALEDRIWNYYVGWLELTQNPEDPMILSITDHFKDIIPASRLEHIFTQAKKITHTGV